MAYRLGGMVVTLPYGMDGDPYGVFTIDLLNLANTDDSNFGMVPEFGFGGFDDPITKRASAVDGQGVDDVIIYANGPLDADRDPRASHGAVFWPLLPLCRPSEDQREPVPGHPHLIPGRRFCDAPPVPTGPETRRTKNMRMWERLFDTPIGKQVYCDSLGREKIETLHFSSQ